jgi:hypothetical protein
LIPLLWFILLLGTQIASLDNRALHVGLLRAWGRFGFLVGLVGSAFIATLRTPAFHDPHEAFGYALAGLLFLLLVGLVVFPISLGNFLSSYSRCLRG